MLVNTRTLLEPYVPRRGQEDRIVWFFLLLQARSGLHFPPLAGHNPNSTVYRRYFHKHHAIMMCKLTVYIFERGRGALASDRRGRTREDTYLRWLFDVRCVGAWSSSLLILLHL